jgi:magnesium transporter
MQVLDRIDEAQIDELCTRDEFFWLDVRAPTAEEVAGLAKRFHWHPLVVEDVTNFRQRPKLESYGDYTLLVFFGAREENGTPALTEVHVIVSGSYVVTVRHAGCHQLEDVHKRFQERPADSEQFVVYRVLDALTDSFFPILETMDEEIDALEDCIVERAGPEELQRVSKLKRTLVEFRRVVTPQRDLAARALEDLRNIPGLDEDSHDYYRDLYDHLIRIADLLDSYRDLMTGLMDIYLSTVSNRLNFQMKDLTIIATIFLPLTFVTGFFGQNFGWLVGHIRSPEVFLIYGVGGLLVPILLLVVYFRRRGYLASPQGGVKS